MLYSQPLGVEKHLAITSHYTCTPKNLTKNANAIVTRPDGHTTYVGTYMLTYSTNRHTLCQMDLIDELNCGWFVPAIFKIWGVNMYRKFDIIGISIPKHRMNIF